MAFVSDPGRSEGGVCGLATSRIGPHLIALAASVVTEIIGDWEDPLDLGELLGEPGATGKVLELDTRPPLYLRVGPEVRLDTRAFEPIAVPPFVEGLCTRASVRSLVELDGEIALVLDLQALAQPHGDRS